MYTTYCIGAAQIYKGKKIAGFKNSITYTVIYRLDATALKGILIQEFCY
ncbi:MAG: hypothetical protein RTU09_02205 [Candidatus Thorarchaeota archaeon]